MKKVVIGLGVLIMIAAVYSAVIDNSFADKEQTSDKKWGESDPPAKYADYCKKKDIRWTLDWQTNYMNGNLREEWEVDENGDSVLTMLHYFEVFKNGGELNYMEKEKTKREREMAKEQWSNINKKIESGELKPKKDIKQYSGE